MHQSNTTPTDHVIAFFIEQAELLVMFRAENGHSQLLQGNKFVITTRFATSVKASCSPAQIIIAVQAPRGCKILDIKRFTVMQAFYVLGCGVTHF